jgi:hypothetical protein
MVQKALFGKKGVVRLALLLVLSTATPEALGDPPDLASLLPVEIVPPAGWDGWSPTELNESGVVIGSVVRTGPGGTDFGPYTDVVEARWFWWTVETGAILPDVVGDNPIEIPMGITDGGWVVVLTADVEDEMLTNFGAYLQSLDGSVSLVGENGFVPQDVNEDLLVAGIKVQEEGSSRAAVWSAQDGLTLLPAVGNGPSMGVSINVHGDVAGMHVIDSDEPVLPLEHAFLWQHSTDGYVAMDLHGEIVADCCDPSIPANTISSRATSVNDGSQVFATVTLGGDANADTKPVLWDNGSVKIFETWGPSNQVFGSNNHGQMVGMAETADGLFVAFAAQDATGPVIVDLNDYVQWNGQDPVVIVGAVDINDQGQVLSDFLLTPVDSSTHTQAGEDVTVSPLPPVTITFAEVTESGFTAVTAEATGPELSLTFALGSPPTYYQIATSAAFSGPVTICIDYAGIEFQDEEQIRLLHFEEAGSEWVDCTVSVQQPIDMVCGEVSSFSLFTVAETAREVSVDIKPGNADNTVNLGSRGVVPVAIFSAPDFDATMVDPTRVTLAGAPVGLRGNGTPMAVGRDVDGDGLLDLVVHAETGALALGESAASAVLQGVTFNGEVVRGRDWLQVVPAP